MSLISAVLRKPNLCVEVVQDMALYLPTRDLKVVTLMHTPSSRLFSRLPCGGESTLAVPYSAEMRCSRLLEWFNPGFWIVDFGLFSRFDNQRPDTYLLLII